MMSSDSSQIGSKAELSTGFILYAVAPILILIYQTAFAIYNTFLHPLSRYPGPKLAAASQIPYAWASIRGKLPEWIRQLHEHYQSEVVRISPRELSFTNPAAWNDINGHRTGRRDLEHDIDVYGRPPNGVDSLLSANFSDHSRMRRVLDHAFSAKAFKDQEPIVYSYVDSLISRLYEQVKGSAEGRVDVVKWYHWMSFDVIGDLAFADKFECLESQRYHPWVEMVFGNLKGLAYITAGSRFPIFRRLLPFLIPKHIKNQINDHWQYTAQKLTQRMALETERPDFLSLILKNNTDEKGISQDEIQSNVGLFVVAGSESIATNLSGATWFLLQNPGMMKRLIEEVHGAFQHEREITVQSVAQLPYLLAVLAETNRMYPTALTGQACIVWPGGDTIDGHWVPGNTGVSINQYAAYRSASNFTYPDTFLPERWLDDPRFASDRREVFHPFSMGARNCIGKILGEAETRLVLTRMIWNFSIEMCEETDLKWDDQEVYLSWQKKPLVVKLVPIERN